MVRPFDRLGMKTTLEMPEPGRSDCHAWGAHPIYHYFASILGIRPASPGFASVVIAPQLGSLESAEGEMVHPAGMIGVRVRREGKGLRARITLPHTICGASFDSAAIHLSFAEANKKSWRNKRSKVS